MVRKLLLVLLALCVHAPLAPAQSLDLTVKHYGISFGDSREINGLRLNFRDRHMRRVNGMNLTLWTPREPAHGTVNGLAVGLPLTGGQQLNGITLGVFGAGADESISGVLLGLVGAGAGKNISGIAVTGIGLGSGNRVRGIAVAGIGLGSGSRLEGIMVGGIGVGSGDEIAGITIGGLGIGSGGDMKWLNVAGIGVGAGGTIRGLSLSLIGVGAGESIRGITIAGIGAGSGSEIRGLTLAGIGIGAPRITGLSAALAIGARNYSGVALAPAYFQVEEDGVLHGLSVSAWNRVRGTNAGVTIGLVNLAGKLKGVQLGLLNIAHSNPKWLRVLPLFNADFSR